MDDPSTVRDAWVSLLGSLSHADRGFLDAARFDFDDFELARAYRHLTHAVALGVDWFMEMDLDRPRFRLIDDGTKKTFNHSPDGYYHYAAVRGGTAFRIRGQRGEERYLNISSYRDPEGEVPALWGGGGQLVGELRPYDIVSDSDGRFEVIVSPEREGENWLPNAPEGSVICVRCYVYDHAAPRVTLDIQPLDPPGSPPRLRQADVAKRLRMMARLVEQCCVALSPFADIESVAPENMNRIANYNSRDPQVVTDDLAQTEWGPYDTTYARGLYRIDPGEALLVEGVVPECAFWGINLQSPFNISVEARQNRASINGSQLRLGTGGEFRVAIVQHDPGDLAVDWISTGGERQGEFWMRVQCARTAPDRPTVRLANLDDLRA